MTGISNGGYLTRWQLENRPDLYDGGVDWEGTLFDSDAGAEPALVPAAGAEALPALPRDGRCGGARRDHRRGLRARLGVPLGRPLRRLLGPHAAHLPRGARPRLGRRDRRRARRSASPGRRTATPTTTTLAAGLRAGGGRQGRQHGQDRQAAADAARHARHAAADPRRLRRLRAQGRRGRARARCTATT